MRAPADNHRADGPERRLPDRTWRINRDHSEISFAIEDMWGLRSVRGRFRAFRGGLEVCAGQASGTLTVEAASIETGNDRRDRHLRSPAFFDAENSPLIVFRATGLSPRGDATLTGEATVGSARFPVKILLEVERIDHGALRLAGTTTVSRQTAGLDWNLLGMIRGDAAVTAELILEAVSSGPQSES